jgi:hypothetical protein
MIDAPQYGKASFVAVGLLLGRNLCFYRLEVWRAHSFLHGRVRCPLGEHVTTSNVNSCAWSFRNLLRNDPGGRSK